MQEWCSLCRTQPLRTCYLSLVWPSDETSQMKHLKLHATLSIRKQTGIKAQTPHFTYIPIPVLLIAFQCIPSLQLLFLGDNWSFVILIEKHTKETREAFSIHPRFPVIVWLLPSASFEIHFLVQFHTDPAFLVPLLIFTPPSKVLQGLEILPWHSAICLGVFSPLLPLL